MIIDPVKEQETALTPDALLALRISGVEKSLSMIAEHICRLEERIEAMEAKRRGTKDG